MANSTRSRSAAKSRKPSFPLWLHSHTGQWCKKIRGHRHYFGTDREAALKEFLRVKEDLQAGRIPPPVGMDRVTLLYVTNAFLTHQQHKVQTGELSQRSFLDYLKTCERMLDGLGKQIAVDGTRPADLLAYRRRLAEKRNAISLGNEVDRTRIVLRFAHENGLINMPVRFGEFRRPSRHVVRRQRAEKGERMFEPAELRQILDAADVQMRAMILLAINCGFGNNDIAKLPTSAVDLDSGWIDFARPKTGVARHCPLWPETVDALRTVIDKPRAPSDRKHEGLVFLTPRGKRFGSDARGAGIIGVRVKRLLVKLSLYRPGLSFYTLRHCFQTIADECGDYIATRRIMGHADNSISDTYRERFPDERLRRVVDHVRGWLVSETSQDSKISH